MEELDKNKSGNPMEGEARGTMSIEEFLRKDEQKDLLRFLTAGSVDDGKSTLIGRLLFDSKKLYEDQLDALERDSKRVGNAGEHIDYALLLDGLKAEREQGITIDVAYRYFSTNNRKFIIADTPGHEQYTRNMITGGSTANLAVILVDARTGVITQTRRHTYLVSLLGIKHVILAVNKMDLVDFSKEVFDKIVTEYQSFIQPLGIPDLQCIPLSALDGDNVVEKSQRTPWYNGPSLLEFLETVKIGNDHNLKDFRYPVQYVLRPNLDFRGFCGKVASGIIRKGDEVVALPSGKKSHIKSIVTYEGEIDYAFPPMSVTLTLTDEIDVSRGEMLVHPDNVPTIGRYFEAMLVWMDEEPMDLEKSFFLKQTTNTSRTRIDHIEYKVDINTMEHLSVENGRLKKEDVPMQLNQIARVTLTSSKELFFDPYTKNKATGAFILIDPITNNTSAVGMIIGSIDEKDIHNKMELPVLNLPKLDIPAEHYGTVDKIDEKKDGRSSKKLSDTYRRRSPEKTAGTKPADYNLGSSPVWIVFRQFRSFRLLERNLPELLIKEGVSPQDYKRLNAYDLSQVLYNHYITKSKPDAERKERANLFLGAKYRFVKAFIRRNKTALRRIMDMRGYDHRYTETLIKHMEQYGVTGGFDVIEKNYTQEMLEELKKRKLLSPEIKVGDPITDDQIARIKAAGFIGTILARDESGNPITGPELNVHHKVAVQDCGEKTNFAEVNQFKNLCLIIEPYHFFAHSLDRTGMANGAEYYVSRIEIGEDVAFYGGFNKLFQIEYDFGQSRTGLYNRNALDAFRNSKRLLDTGDEYWQPDKMPRRQKKAAKKLKQKQALAEKNTQNTNNAVPPVPINRPPEKDEEIIEKPVRTKEKAAQRRDKISRKKDEYMRLRKNLIEKRKQYLTLRAAKKSAIKTISRFEDERKLEKLIQYTMKSQGRKR